MSWAALSGVLLLASAAHPQEPPSEKTEPVVMAQPTAEPALLVTSPSRPAALTPASRRVAAPAVKPAPAPPPYDWNVGAGIFFGDETASPSSLIVAPRYAAILERRLGGQTWIGLNVMGGYQKREVPVQALSPDAEPNRRLELDVTTTSAGVILGIRQTFVEGIVNASVFLGAFAGYEAIDGDELGPEESVSLFEEPGSKKRVIGLLGGLAVERRLVEALSLRLSLDLARASVVRTQSVERDYADGERLDRDLTARELTLSVRPALQLHFYF